jgi:hypothetical protein
LKLIAGRQAAVLHLATYNEAQYREAASLCRSEHADYAQAVSVFALDKDLGKIHRPLGLEDLADSACIDLLTCLAVCFERSRSGSRSEVADSRDAR